MFKKIKIDKSYFYQVNKELIKEELNWAYNTAQAKFIYTIDYWERGCLTKFFDIYFGDLAKNIIKSFIERNTKMNILEFDRVRTDQFTKHDQYDLMIRNHEIEVKSSLEKYTNNLFDLYNKRRIIIGLYKQNEIVPDYRVQVFFIPIKIENSWNFMENDQCNCGNLNVHKKDILKLLPKLIGEIDIVIAGWIKKEDEEEKISNITNTLKINNNPYNNQKREYINFFINETRDMDDLLEELLSLEEVF